MRLHEGQQAGRKAKRRWRRLSVPLDHFRRRVRYDLGFYPINYFIC
jgi:hypothetical protein